MKKYIKAKYILRRYIYKKNIFENIKKIYIKK